MRSRPTRRVGCGRRGGPTEPRAKRTPNARGEGERLRQEILDAATRILEDAGREDALSLRGVAREVGISAPSIYLHFTDRAQLVATVLESAYGALAASMREAGARPGADAWERIRATVAAYRRFAVDKPRRYRLMFSLQHEPGHATGSGGPFRTVLAAWTAAVDAYLAAVRPDLHEEAEVLAIHLWTAVHGQLVLWRTLPSGRAGGEETLIEPEESLLRRLLPAQREAAGP